MQPMPTAPPAKKTNWALYLGGGCLLLLVLCCVVPAGGFVGGNAMLKSKVRRTIDDFVQAGHRRDSAAMYGTLAPSFRSTTSPEMLTSGLGGCTGLSTYTSYDVAVTADHPFDDFLIATVTYQTPQGEVRGSFGIENEGASPQVWNYSEYGAGVCSLRSGY